MTSRRFAVIEVEHSIKPPAPVNREGVLTSVPYAVHIFNVDSATARCRLLSIGERQRASSRVAKESSEECKAIGEDIAYVQFKWPIGKPHVDHLRRAV